MNILGNRPIRAIALVAATALGEVWLAKALAPDLAALWGLAGGDSLSTQGTQGTPGPGAAGDALVALSSVLVLLAGLWLLVISTALASEVLVHPTRLSRSLLTLGGIAVLTGMSLPAQASGNGSAGLDGLPLPDRTVDSATTAPGQPVTDTRQASSVRVVTVRAGDSLWQIASGALPRGATDARIDDLWHQIHALNRDTVGADPDLILPGQRLRVPPTDHTTTAKESR